MVKHKKLGMAVAGACALFGASAAHAFNVRAGDWDLNVAGNVNQFYTYTRCNNNNSVDGGLACASGDKTNASSSVRSGLLPSAIVFSAKTTQEGFDLGVTFGFYPDTSINASQFSDGGINMRQNFLTFGDKEMGTIKMGRDLGIFGSDAIINDFTILGVGTTGGNLAPGNTSLGRIGLGYIYADWIPQITYISTNSMLGVGGLQGSIGVFQPLIAQTIFGVSTSAGPPATVSKSAVLSGHETPGVQGKLTYDYDSGGLTGRVWAGFFYQRAVAIGSDPLASSGTGVTAYAGDVGIKAAYAGWEPVIYYYQGRGIGTTSPLLQGASAAGKQRNSSGGYGQLSYRMGKWKPGISYGVSRLNLASGESPSTLVFFNRAAIAQLQYSLTKALTLVGEYTWTKATNHASPSVGNIEGSVAVGAILFF